MPKSRKPNDQSHAQSQNSMKSSEEGGVPVGDEDSPSKQSGLGDKPGYDFPFAVTKYLIDQRAEMVAESASMAAGSKQNERYFVFVTDITMSAFKKQWKQLLAPLIFKNAKVRGQYKHMDSLHDHLGDHLGIAVATYTTREAADDAISTYNGKAYGPIKLSVEHSNERDDRVLSNRSVPSSAPGQAIEGHSSPQSGRNAAKLRSR